jgi:hypothetical protein
MFLGTYYECMLQVRETRLRAQVPRSLPLKADDEAFESARPESCILVVDDRRARLGDEQSAELDNATVAAPSKQAARQPGYTRNVGVT